MGQKARAPDGDWCPYAQTLPYGQELRCEGLERFGYSKKHNCDHDQERHFVEQLHRFRTRPCFAAIDFLADRYEIAVEATQNKYENELNVHPALIKQTRIEHDHCDTEHPNQYKRRIEYDLAQPIRRIFHGFKQFIARLRFQLVQFVSRINQQASH